jgi:hypothetical protein
MLRWMFFIGVALVATGCSLISGDSDECEVPGPELVSLIESGLTLEGASLAHVRAARSVAYDKMYFVAARVEGVEVENPFIVPIWGVDDLRNPEFIHWANDRAREVSNWGNEEYFGSSTDGIGRARFCSDQAAKGS